MSHPQSLADEFQGFDEARRLMWCYEARARVRDRLELTDFIVLPCVMAVHVDNIARADRVYLTSFDYSGQRVGCDTLYVDEPAQRLDVAPEFDHDYTGMEVPAGSELEAAIAEARGWVIDMSELRTYDVLADRRQTQRKVFLAHLGDMMNSGQAKGFLFGQSEADDSDAA